MYIQDTFSFRHFYSPVNFISWGENFILGTLLPRRQHFLTRKFHSRDFYYLVDDNISWRENFILGTSITSWTTTFLDKKISFSALLLPRRQHFLTRTFHSQHFYYLVDNISWQENLFFVIVIIYLVDNISRRENFHYHGLPMLTAAWLQYFFMKIDPWYSSRSDQHTGLIKTKQFLKRHA